MSDTAEIISFPSEPGYGDGGGEPPELVIHIKLDFGESEPTELNDQEDWDPDRIPGPQPKTDLISSLIWGAALGWWLG